MDLAMDFDPASPTYGDVVLKNGDLQFTSDVDPTGPNYILQDVVQRIRTFKGEWFMDTSAGVPFLQEIMRKAPNVARIELAFSSVILATPGVSRIVSLVATPNYAQRTIAVTFTLQTVTGQVTYTGAVGAT